jgi:hypothetical protein
MPRIEGTRRTLGGQTANYFWIDYTNTDDAPNNRTLVTYSVGFRFTGADAQLDDGVANLFGQRWRVAGRVHNFSSNFTTRDLIFVNNEQFFVPHNTDGTGSYDISGGIGGNLGGRSDISNRTIPLTNYNRTANTPSFTEITRTSSTNFRVNYSLSGSVNGPTTYVVQISTTSDFSSGVTSYTNPARPFDIGVNANTSYWFRMYAFGDENGNQFSSTLGPYHGQPTAPSIGTPSQITNSQKRISVPFSAPGYVGSGITSYTITRSGTPAATFTGVTSSPYIDTDTNLIPGNSYTYTVTALTSGYTSNASGPSAAVIASGPPYAPTSPPTFTVNGLDITVTSAAVSGNGGVAIDTGAANQGYYLQYQTSTTLDGTYGAWSTPVKMSDQANRRHTLTSLTPALFYKFRTYAANTVIFGSNGSSQLYYPHNNSSFTANFATTATGYFLAAGGRRWTGTAWEPTAIAKRWDPALNSGSGGWGNLTIAKRWDPAANGGSGGWVNLS